MGTFILFVFGDFEDHGDIEFFCLEHFSEISEKGVKYVIENDGNCIIIFETEKTKQELHDKLSVLLAIEQIKFYFLFERSSIVSTYLPETLKDFVFKPMSEENIKLLMESKPKPSMDLDDILDKIDQQGVNSLTDDEKKFLDDFGK
jgi:hypothetical protein